MRVVLSDNDGESVTPYTISQRFCILRTLFQYVLRIIRISCPPSHRTVPSPSSVKHCKAIAKANIITQHSVRQHQSLRKLQSLLKHSLIKLQTTSIYSNTSQPKICVGQSKPFSAASSQVSNRNLSAAFAPLGVSSATSGNSPCWSQPISHSLNAYPPAPSYTEAHPDHQPPQTAALNS